MKTTAKSIILISLLIIQITACHKDPVINPPVEVQSCKIAYMTTNRGSAIFTYDSHGNPKNIKMGNVTTGNPNRTFLYDKYNRLTDYIGTYIAIPDSIGSFEDLVNSGIGFYFEFWNRYTYSDENPNSLPKGDTARMAGGFSQGVFGPIVSYTRIETFTYDSQNRIVGDGYNYDANGNLILPNVTYDNKKNYRQTNKVWMLIDRDYSKNNPFIATAYNSEGYPTVFPDQFTVLPRRNFTPYPLLIKTMDYSCSTGQKAD